MEYEAEEVVNPLMPIYLIGGFNDFAFKSSRYLDRITGDEQWFTLIEPPSTSDNTVAIFDKESQSWSVVEDYRGLLATHIETGESVLVDYVGAVKEGFAMQR